MGDRRAAQVWAAVVALCSWLIVMGGLWLSPASTDQEVDLEGGGNFAAAFTVYWPALGITLLVVGAMITSAFTRAWAATAVTLSITTAAFSSWTLSQGYLMAYRPSLDIYLWASLALAGLAMSLVLAASATKAQPVPR